MTVASINAIIVLHAFGPYARGEMVTDPMAISAILSGGHASMVIQTRVPQNHPIDKIAGEEH